MSNEHRIRILKDKRELINEVSSCFCSAKWLQTTLYLHNGYTHSCHHPAPHVIPLHELEQNPAALHNTVFKKTQRASMLAGDRPQECNYCWNIEDLDTEYFSDRHYKTSDSWAWDRFDEISKSNPADDINPSYLEVSFSNNCNFKCVYCSPEISSSWMTEIKKYGPYPTTVSSHDLTWLTEIGKYPYDHNEYNPYVDAFWKWFPVVLPSLKIFRITGGEPLMSPDTWKVIDYIKTNPQPSLELVINTNLGVSAPLITKLIDEINLISTAVKSIEIYTSLESTGEDAEYARFGLNFNEWIENVNLILTNTTCKVAIMTTVNILSLPTFTNFIELIMSFRKKYNNDFAYNRIPLSINYLQWPPYLSVKLLPDNVRKTFSENILTACESWLKYYRKETFARLYLEEWDQIQRFCEFLIQPCVITNERLDFVNFINEADKRRSTKFAEIFPVYKNLLEDWQHG